MSAPDTGQRALLAGEFDRLSRFVAGSPVSDERLRERYVEAHELGAVRPACGVGGYDRALVALAQLGTLGARAADAHAAVLDHNGLLRHKLVLVLALLESAAPSEERIDRPGEGGLAGFVLGAALRGGSSALLLALGLLPLLAIRAACAVLAPRRPAPEGSPAP